MADSSRFEYVIRSPSDIQAVAVQIESDFTEIAVPYFEGHSELKQIDAALNATPDGECVHYAMDYLRYTHGLIVARLIGRPDYLGLVDTYRRKLAHVSNGFYLPEFEALVSDLAKS
jgi:hypothetical protein